MATHNRRERGATYQRSTREQREPGLTVLFLLSMVGVLFALARNERRVGHIAPPPQGAVGESVVTPAPYQTIGPPSAVSIASWEVPESGLIW
jgi:hypothetical protein